MSVILQPFRIILDNEIDVATGTRLAQSMVEQVLMTKAKSPRNLGEYHPEPNFGCLIYTLRGSTDPDPVIKSQAHGFVADSFRKWLPGFKFETQVVKIGGTTSIRVFWSYNKFRNEVDYTINEGIN